FVARRSIQLSYGRKVVGPKFSLTHQRPAALRNAAIFGARLFGLSKLNDRASPSCVRTYSSVRATAFSKSRFFGMKDIQAIESCSVSYSQTPTSRPRSKIP